MYWGYGVTLRLGLMFSTTGSYDALGKSALAGALGAIEALRARGVADITPVIRDPGGDVARYERDTAELLEAGVHNILGAITSWSRKDMIPVLERYGGLLWYPCPYEGFESNDHVIYLGATPNHHVVPATGWIAAQGLKRAYLVGSNYVWGWETLRLARECLRAQGVEILGERYVPLGSVQHRHVVEEICELGVDCVVDSLIGPSNATFLQALAARDPGRVGRPGHVVSFNQTEADLAELGPGAEGLLSAGPLFECEASANLVTAARRHAPNGRVSAVLASSYAAVEIFAVAVARAGSDDPAAVFRSAAAAPVATAMGDIGIDPVLRHAAFCPRLALVEDGRFRVIRSEQVEVPADPYLTGRTSPQPTRRADLRVVK
mgnify:CR=1 FL=1